MSLPERTKRALKRDPQVLRLDDSLFLVESHSKSEKEWYEVSLEDWDCDCPDYKFRGNRCYHLRAAIIKSAQGQVEDV